MKIAVVSMIHEPWGGSEELWGTMAIKAMEQRHQVFHSTLAAGHNHEKVSYLVKKGLTQIQRRGLVAPGTKTFIRILTKISNYIISNFLSNPFNALFKKSPDVVVYNGTCYSIANDVLLLNKIEKRGKRLIIIAHYNHDTQRLITEAECNQIKHAYSVAEKVLFVSERNLNTAQRHLSSPITNAKIIRNPVNLNSIDAILFPNNETAQFAMVGNLVTIHKGQDLVLDILKSDHWRKRNWHLNIYGSGKDEQYLKNLCSFYQLDERVTFHGKVSDIRAVWGHNHLLLMPSLMEGMPLAVVEAMLCGRPAVVTDVGGHSEWIIDGKEGFVAEAASVKSLKTAMEQAWLNKNNWEQMGKTAHDKAIRLYDADAGQTLLNYLLNK